MRCLWRGRCGEGREKVEDGGAEEDDTFTAVAVAHLHVVFCDLWFGRDGGVAGFCEGRDELGRCCGFVSNQCYFLSYGWFL